MLPSPFNSAYISSPYGPRDIGFHSGTDWGSRAGAYPGAPIRASGPGLVTFSGWNGDRPGNVKTVLYDGFSLARRVVYCHLQSLNGARVNQRVDTGDIIGYVGDTGSAKGYHLHAELVGGGDPMKLIFDSSRYVGDGRPAAGTDEQGSDEMSAEAEKAIFEIRQLLTETEQWKGIGLLVSEIYSIVGEIRQTLVEEEQWVGMDVRLTQVLRLVERITPVQTDSSVDYERVADAVCDRFREEPLK